MNKIILGLGSNLGEPLVNLRQAIELIEDRLLKNITRSKIYRFPALMPEGAPVNWDIDFANMVIAGSLKDEITTPDDGLKLIKKIESDLGRVPSKRWAPRIIDIDILAWGDEVIKTRELSIPHIAMLEREFVLLPLNNILPNWRHPVSGKTVSEHLAGVELWKYLEY